MLYSAYQWHTDMTAPLRRAAELAIVLLNPLRRLPGLGGFAPIGAAWEMLARAGLSHERPHYGISQIRLSGREVQVTEEVFHATPFGTLLHFKKKSKISQPRVLVVAPLSGHFATLLRGTVQTLLPDYDVFLTDWHNARDIPVAAGPFGFDEYIAHIIDFLEAVGPGSHMIAVCQPCVHALAAVAVMAADKNPAQPRSMTLMAGPVDTRVNPTKINALANDKSIEWFERNLISAVPARHKGGGRRVYPGFVQISAFVAMKAARHAQAHRELFTHLVNGNIEKSETFKAFYDEYFAVFDLPGEFYLETVAKVFQDAALAKGELTYQGRNVNPGAIKRTVLLTVEGGRDDICAPGQTVAAHDLCTGLRPAMKRHHLQAGVGHYGVFSGRRWEAEIYPVVRKFIQSAV
ncbi:MAG: polyhydroxyalkanoate depolymerase [Rhodospirillaceae bacterium]|nr:polyhydroxyalkanoate depolymerase [Rhodospirillaceae bacterium]